VTEIFFSFLILIVPLCMSFFVRSQLRLWSKSSVSINKAIDEMYSHSLSLVQIPMLDPYIANAVNVLMESALDTKISRSFAMAVTRVSQGGPSDAEQTKASHLLVALEKLSDENKRDFYALFNRAVFVSSCGDLPLGWLTRIVIWTAVVETKGNKAEIRETNPTYITPAQTDHVLATAA
jgi:hypothetical protein